MADPTFYFGGVAHYKSVIGDVFGNYRACAYKSIFADGVPANNGGVSAYGTAFFQERFFVFMLTAHMASRVD
ncbi:MAG: hypothetical protein M0P94_05035, partial [Candidatus Absconditabacterales bacterium]|nr:hypothetical protein [Candidatus Absconditabacterales bacterium]